MGDSRKTDPGLPNVNSVIQECAKRKCTYEDGLLDLKSAFPNNSYAVESPLKVLTSPTIYNESVATGDVSCEEISLRWIVSAAAVIASKRDRLPTILTSTVRVLYGFCMLQLHFV